MTRQGYRLDAGQGKANASGNQSVYSWSFNIPAGGWTDTVASIGFAGGDAPAAFFCGILLDGADTGKAEIGRRKNESGTYYNSVAFGEVKSGDHFIEIRFPSSFASAFSGVWITNGPLINGWPERAHVDEFFPLFAGGGPEPVPENTDSSWSVEFGAQGLSTHFNQQGAMGTLYGKLTAIPRSLHLRYADCELNVMAETENGLRRIKDIDPEIELSLLDGYLPCPVARFGMDGMEYEIVFASVPEQGEAADMIKVKVTNKTDMAAKDCLVIALDAAEDLKVEEGRVIAAGETAAYFSGNVKAERVTREAGLADPRATVAAAAWATPFMDMSKAPYDASFFSYRIGWDGQPVKYRLSCNPGSKYAVYAGICNSAVGNPGQKKIYGGEKAVLLHADGMREPVRIDCRSTDAPSVARLDAWDEDGDGNIGIYGSPDTDIPGAVGMLNMIWVFPDSEQVNEDDLIHGKLNEKALYHIDVGGSAPGYVVDRVISEDWTFAYAKMSLSHELLPGQSVEYAVALPVNHRPEIMCYSQPRHWREPDEDAPGFGMKLEKRHKAAKSAVSNPAKALDKVREYWEEAVKCRTRIGIPEKKVENLYKSSLCYFGAQSLEVGENHLIPMGGGPMFYFDFTERDDGYVLVSLDNAGMSGLAERMLGAYLTKRGEIDNKRWFLGQDKDGKWMSRENEEDTQGQVLWSLGEHFMLTGDAEWLKKAWPWIKRGLEYIRAKRREQKARFPDPADPRHGMWIAGTDESKSFGTMTHSYYFSYWIECALRVGVAEAMAMLETEYAEELRKEHKDFVECMRRSIQRTYCRIDHRRGMLPDTVEKPFSANAWGTQESLWPSHTLNPWDVRAGRTLSYLDSASYSLAGIFACIPHGIWPSATGDYAMMHLRRGDGDKAVEGFYGMLSTCGKVNSWSETIHVPTGTGHGEQPYMWANAAFVILLRNMLAHEAGEWISDDRAIPEELWICPATPRKWLDSSEGITVENLPTYFGEISFTFRRNSDKCSYSASIKLPDRTLPKRLVVFFRTMEGKEPQKVVLNGGSYECFTGERIMIPSPGRQIEVTVWM